jgi:hypothetical protein
MKYQELRNHILGSHLMRHDLEAFLIQGAYIEGLLKIYADYKLYNETEGKSYSNKLLGAIRSEIEKYSLFGLIELLKKAECVSNSQKDLLDNYRKRRNKVLHDLLGQVTEESFERDLVDVYKMGENIINDNEFKGMEELLDNIEKDVEERKKNEINKQRILIPEINRENIDNKTEKE